MKRLLVGLSLLACGLASATDTGWKITEVAPKETVGYIYHTSAVGTQRSTNVSKVHASLRLVCSVKSNADPVIVIFWNNSTGSGEHNIRVMFPGDLTTNQVAHVWTQDGPLYIRSLPESKSLIEKMKVSKSIRFNWGSQTESKSVIFDLQDFGAGLTKFKEACNTKPEK